MSRINCRISKATFGLPERGLDFQPVGFEPRTMPANDGLWPNDRQRRSHNRKQSVEPDEHQPVKGVEPKSLRRYPPQDQDLLAQNQIFAFKSRSRSEQPDDSAPNQSAAVPHRAGASPDSCFFANGCDLP